MHIAAETLPDLYTVWLYEQVADATLTSFVFAHTWYRIPGEHGFIPMHVPQPDEVYAAVLWLMDVTQCYCDRTHVVA